MTSRPILFVGSIPLSDADAVFRALAASVGDAAKRYPDGETGARTQFIRWQKATFENHPDFELAAANADYTHGNDAIPRPFFALRAGAEPADVTIDSLGYAAVATDSYASFARLKEAGAIPAGVRFQVSLPTPVALVNGFVEASQRDDVEPLVEAAMAREVAAICAAVPHDRLTLQWDVAHEIIAADGGFPMHYGDGDHDAMVAMSVERLCRYLGWIPADVEAGVHLCYGDPGHKHVIEPEDLATCVAFTNGIVEGTPRPLDFIHMPVPRDRDDDAYFAPLDALALPPETELYLGLIHLTGGVEGTQRRIAAAEAHARDFGIATECGFGRRDPATVDALLDVHAIAAAG
jgi:hypothetical protein